MRNTSILLLLPSLLLSFSASQRLSAQEWQWAYPRPGGVPGIAIDFVDDRVGWLVTEWNNVLRTTDGGETWEQVSQYIADTTIYFPYVLEGVNSDVAYFGFRDPTPLSFRRTTDGGATWTDFDTTRAPRFTSLRFITPQKGWGVVRKSPTIVDVYQTDDRGETWRKLDAAMKPLSVCPVDAGTIFLNGADNIYRSNDGGGTWQILSQPGSADLHFLDRSVGWAYRRGVLTRTVDGGATWTRIREEPSETVKLRWIRFFSLQSGYRMLEWHREYYERTTDGGTTWLYDSTMLWKYDGERTSVGDAWIFGFAWPTMEIGKKNLRTGAQRLLSDEGGRSVKDIHFFNADEGVALLAGAGMDSLLLRTSDGGDTWRLDDVLPGRCDWTSLDATGDTLWAAGKRQVCVSYDRGNTWQIILDEITSDLDELTLFDGTRGLISADTELLFFSDHGGDWHFEQVRSLNAGLNERTTILDCEAVTDEFGWILAGEQSINTWRLLLTNDGGRSWNLTDPGRPPVRPAFITDSIGYLPGRPIRVTLDQGGTWFPLESYDGTAFDTPLLIMSDRYHGFVLDEGTFLETYDAGQSWHRETPLPAFRWDRLVCPDRTACWAVGMYGLLKVTTSGTTGVRGEGNRQAGTSWRPWYDPTGKVLNLHSPSGCIGDRITVSLVDIRGNLIACRELPVADGSALLNMQELGLHSGLYVLRVECGAGIGVGETVPILLVD